MAGSGSPDNKWQIVSGQSIYDTLVSLENLLAAKGKLTPVRDILDQEVGYLDQLISTDNWNARIMIETIHPESSLHGGLYIIIPAYNPDGNTYVKLIAETNTYATPAGSSAWLLTIGMSRYLALDNREEVERIILLLDPDLVYDSGRKTESYTEARDIATELNVRPMLTASSSDSTVSLVSTDTDQALELLREVIAELVRQLI